MSVDIEWHSITTGSDGEALAESIRDFVHTKFQQITLPRFINSVHVHSFDFGDVCPDIEIKDICDPLPDFYEDDEEDETEDDDPPRSSSVGEAGRATAATGRVDQEHLQKLQNQILHAEDEGHRSRTTRPSYAQHSKPSFTQPLADPFVNFSRGGTPGIPGGTSNFSYFHLPIGGMSGTQTPLAAVASGTPFTPTLWTSDQRASAGHPIVDRTANHQTSAFETRRSTSSSIASPPDPGQLSSSDYTEATPEHKKFMPARKVSDDLSADRNRSSSMKSDQAVQPSDLQVVARVKYAGNVKMMLTAEILLDYPMPSFVGIPLKLSITGMTFDGVAILAYIKKRMHFCFLSPEDADALVGDQIRDDAGGPTLRKSSSATTGLLQEIHVESEIGRKEKGKQVLKNVGKVEKFVLEQVRRIFEEEFVFPSFWTFLI